MKRVLGASRYLVLFAVVNSLILAATLLVCSVIRTGALVIRAATGTKSLKSLTLDSVVLVDAFLIGTVFVLIALGLYSLFVDDTLPLPKWLEVHTLDDLKYKLINVIVLVLAVTFLSVAVGWKGQKEVLHIGGAIALVIFALTSFLGSKPKERSGSLVEEIENSKPQNTLEVQSAPTVAGDEG
ncbi:MAG TPA: YqhA family protein [Abditibacteriaceae bacterium]|jgi:uncharacterized membrane protein YqhA